MNVSRGDIVTARIIFSDQTGAKQMSNDDRWSVATGQDGDKPLIFRIRNHPPTYAHKGEFPHLLAVSWRFDSQAEMDMPTEDVVAHMADFEGLLRAALEEPGQAFLTVIVTGNGVREWQWYSRDEEETMRLVNEGLGDHDPFPVTFSFMEDPEWTAFQRFQEITSS